jgi:hypothetical protein
MTYGEAQQIAACVAARRDEAIAQAKPKFTADTLKRGLQPRDTSNKFLVRGRPSGDLFFFETPTASPILVKLDRAGALNLAVWLQVLADPGGEEIARLLKEIKR